VRSGGWQIADGAVGRLVVGGSTGIPGSWSMAARANPTRRHVGVGRGDVRRRSAAQTDGDAWPRDRALPRRSGRRLAGERVALRGGARSSSALRPRLSRVLTGTTAVSSRRGTRSIRAGGCWCPCDRCDGDRGRLGLPPRTKFVVVGDAHEVAVPRGLKVQAPEPDFESGWERVRTTHGIPLAAVLSANHHREGW
jgi:hypothetical protein